MPRPRTTAKVGFPVDPKDCRAVRHLAGPEFKVYDQMVAYAFAGRTSREGRDATGPLLFNAAFKPTLCNALALSVNQTYLMRDRLEKLGWIVLVKEGAQRSDGTDEPDTWRVVQHDEFVRTHPGTCPDNPEPETPAQRQERRARQVTVEGRARIARMVMPDWTTPQSRAFADALAKFTDTDWQAIRDHMGLDDQEWEQVRPNKPVPTVRDRATSPYAEVPAPVPTDRDRTSPYETEQPVPTKRSDQSLCVGTNTLTTTVTTPTHTQPTTPQPVGGVVDETPSAIDAEREVDDLLAGFAKANYGAGKLTGTQKKKITELVLRHGREKFRRAAANWFANPSWNNETTDPFLGFINGFVGYLAAADIAIKEQQSKLTPEQIAEWKQLSKARHAAFWKIDAKNAARNATAPEPDADAFFDDEK